MWETDQSSWGVHWAVSRMNVEFSFMFSLPLFLSLLLSRRPRRTLHLWTGASSWLKRNWIELRRDSPRLCRNWKRLRRLQTRVRGVCVCGLDLDESSPKYWIIESNVCIYIWCKQQCDSRLYFISVLLCSTLCISGCQILCTTANPNLLVCHYTHDRPWGCDPWSG